MPHHAKYSASASHRWLHCPGSATLAAAAPEAPAGDAARNGTIGHMIAELLLDGHPVALDAKGADTLRVVVEPHTVRLARADDAHAADLPVAILDAARTYARFVQAIREKYEGRHVLSVEHRTELVPGLCGGTADAVIETDDGALFVLDLKTGFRRVEAVNNMQLLIYAAAIICARGSARPVDRVTLAIVQPSDDDDMIRSWRLTADEVLDAVMPVYAAIERGEDAARAGRIAEALAAGDHCTWCPAAATCPALRALALTAARSSLPDLAPASPPDPATLDASQIRWALDNGPAIVKWLDAVRDHALRRAAAGDAIPGWKIVESVTRRRVRDPEALIADAAAHGWDVTRPALLPLKDLEKAVPSSVLAGHIIKPAGAPTLAPESDKRKPIACGAAGLPELPPVGGED